MGNNLNYYQSTRHIDWMANITSPPATPPPASPTNDDNGKVETSTLDPDQVKESLRDADEIKQEGNTHFRSKQWTEALVSYRSALARVPPRKEDPAPSTEKGKDRQASPPPGDEQAGPSEPTVGEVASPPAQVPMTALELDCAKARSVINANIAACHVKLGEHAESVAACTKSLLDDPTYVKALQRRAASNTKINSWSSLSGGQEDYTSLLALLPPDSAQHADAKRELALLKPRVEGAQKEETAEMLGKLKGLGNSLLGNFGLSTDNFKFEPNGQGGYSMNFSK
ncbi:hypothetical protein FIBSPDRAFT_907413 [Athelia psychrophila]|uniref:TPR-like protein n=1 Tax=Athelia psychrophila TaxID=1759441 RepID=A0A166V5P8_9AGAM|nr:hypothetical protein FIBSPDRAFT_907413 [Fibularhizoctonia sp. CBS 109695]